MKKMTWFVLSLIFVTLLILWMMAGLREKEVLSDEGLAISSKIIATSIEYKISIGQSVPIKDTPLNIKLLEIDEMNKKCRLSLLDSSTGESVVFWALQDQPIHEANKYFSRYGPIMVNLGKDSVSLLIPDRCIIISETEMKKRDQDP